MTKFPPGSMGEADAKSAKTFAIIAIIGFIAIHIIAYFLSSAPLGVLHKYPMLWAVSIGAFVWLFVCVRAVLLDSFWATESKWPYIILIILAFFSAVCVGYNPGA